MRCIRCDNEIRINTLKQLFAWQPLLLCGHCSPNLVSKSTDFLFEDNEWMRSVIDKLNQGDLILIQLFKNELKKALAKHSTEHLKIEIIESKKDLPYPWLEILVNSVMKDAEIDASNASIGRLIVAVEKQECRPTRQEGIDSQIAIIG